MKKTFTIFAVLLSFCVSAQDTLSNYGLNSWETPRVPSYNWAEPIGWTSSNWLTEALGAGVSQTQIPQSGSLQAQIKTLNVFGQDIPGLLINGDFPISIADTARIPLLGGEPMSTVKSKAYGLYNFISGDTTDSATIIIAFKKFNTSTQKPEAVAMGTLRLAQTQAGLYPFTIDIQALNANTPDSVSVTIVSTGVKEFKTGGVLTVDFLQFSQPTCTCPLEPQKMEIYPNPVQNDLYVSLPSSNNLESTNYIVTDVLGKTVLSGTITNNSLQNIDVASLYNGYYFIHLDNTTETRTFKFIKK